MKILFICRASEKVGLGHLIRSRTLALSAAQRHTIEFLVIGSATTTRLLFDKGFRYHILASQDEIAAHVEEPYDIIVFDLIHLSHYWCDYLKKRARLCACISPIFDKMGKMDLLFTRTKHRNGKHEAYARKRYAGLEYTIVQESCKPIPERRFRANLSNEKFPIAISMGGGDAANKTLNIIKSLQKCKVSATFWVLIGECYNHSIDLLIKSMDTDRNHEIVLAKTNVSMWSILHNCVIAILSGGVTAYEAAYAGLPTITMSLGSENIFLIRELVENGATTHVGVFCASNLVRLNHEIERLYYNRQALLEMHRRCKKLIDEKGCRRIISILENELGVA
jgi:spore coat polysaccharide biosynthesis predicted glycosyltransferase SpsG